MTGRGDRPGGVCSDDGRARARGEQRAARDAIIRGIRDALADEPSVAALWLGGSLARGRGDALSDVDLVLVARAGHSEEAVSRLPSHIGGAGELALLHAAPQNAPRGGAHLNALYDIRPLPLFVDWNLWPMPERRPCDVHVLFERAGLGLAPGPSSAEMLAEIERGAPPAASPEGRRAFELMMVPIIAKNAARGRFDRVRSLCGLVDVSPPERATLEAMLEVLTGTLDRSAGNVGDEGHGAVACVRRYVEAVEVFADP